MLLSLVLSTSFILKQSLVLSKSWKKAGCTVNYNPDQTCCGQPSFNSGYWKETKTFAVKFLKDFENSGIIVAPSASCTGFIKNYYKKLFEEDPQLLSKVTELTPRIYEFSDFLVNHLQKIEFGTVFNHKVTFMIRVPV